MFFPVYVFLFDEIREMKLHTWYAPIFGVIMKVKMFVLCACIFIQFDYCDKKFIKKIIFGI